MKKLSLLLILLPALLSGQSITATYEDGDIPTSAEQYSESCNGPLTTLELELPAGSFWQVTGVNVQYTMTAQFPAWKSHQRSMIYCENTATGESSAAQGIGNTHGTQSYKRNGLNIANGIYPGNTTLVFQMRAWRAESLNFGCNTLYSKVDNSSWSITVHYEQAPDDGGAGIGTMSPDASAILELQSMQKGFLPPRMSTAFRQAIPNPATGLMVYDTDLGSMMVFDGTEWLSMAVGDIQWAASGSDIYYEEGNVGIGASEPAALLHAFETETGGGNVLFEGELKNTDPGDPPAEGAGTRMMWYPDKAAFRVGNVNGNQWNKGQIGLSSFASGFSTTASGHRSTAMGSETTAAGFASSAIGFETQATGDWATALGIGTIASGSYSTALGNLTIAPSYAETVLGIYNTEYTANSSIGWNENDRLFVIGNGYLERSNAITVLKSGNTGVGTDTPAALLHIYGTGRGGGNVIFVGQRKSSDPGDPPFEGPGDRMMWYADKAAFRVGRTSAELGHVWNKDSIGLNSVAMGFNTTASGNSSFAIGYATIASGYQSTALGRYTIASGQTSTAIGERTTAASYVETVIGRYNLQTTPHNATGWNPNDRLFVIGNGTAEVSRSNAMTVLKNGNIALGTHTPHGNALLSTWRSGPGQAGVVFEGQVYDEPGDPPTYFPGGLGTRMMWYPDKAAFRAGEVIEDFWNKNAIGYHSVAMNYNTLAEGNGSVAMGINTSAPSYGETALGVYNTYYIPGSTTEWNDNDRLFVIGNGDLMVRRNALTLFKNGNMALGAHSAGNHRLKVVSSAPGSGGATAYFENEHTSGIALSASSNSDDGTMLVTQHGDGYIMRLDRFDPNWGVSMIVKGNRVGINTDDPTRTLDVAGELRVRHTHLVYGQSFPLYINPDGTLTKVPDGKSQKTNIKPIENSLQKVLQLRGVSFNWIESPDLGEFIGMIAEEVEEVLPKLVNTHEKDGLKAINHNQLNALLVEAIKEQQAIIEAQNQLNAEMFKELESLRLRMNALESSK